MKKIILPILLCIILAASTHNKAIAQANIDANITAQPLWGPIGYEKVDYYYLPDVESYYSVASHQFVYLSNGRWTYSATLPPQYKNYDLYSGYKVVINSARPYLNFSQDKVQYNKYKDYKNKQKLIRDVRYAKEGGTKVLQPGSGKKKDTTGDYGPR